ncbi:hypothetical protein [Mycolicibacterium mengxianglii]|uniref:hypothetical protein n=1 Tax=Mycolicibacterium mengxianglii TaxID=2736649 RepID=UPI0018D0DEF0|nr:hypothetical protein [Mycolicibacterium mengxianglii]
MSRKSRLPELFVLATGQDDNIGDVILRREYLDRLRPIGHLNIFVGSSSEDFLDGLRLHASDTTYTDFADWHSDAWRALVRNRIWLVDKPGELQLDVGTLRRQLRLLPLVTATRLTRGQVLRLGIAMRAANTLYLTLLRPLYLLSSMIGWRDTATGPAFGFGEVEPDWAFGWTGSDPEGHELDRPHIVVSYRADREPPSDSILDAIVSAAISGGRRVLVVTQVRRDAERSHQLAARLGAELVSWPEERSSVEHEKILRNIYRTSAVVISNRLHALIVAMTEGAVPLCITEGGEPKINRHLEAAGYNASTICLNDTTSLPLAELIKEQIERRVEALDASRTALRRLDALSERLKAIR